MNKTRFKKVSNALWEDFEALRNGELALNDAVGRAYVGRAIVDSERYDVVTNMEGRAETPRIVGQQAGPRSA